MQSRRQTERETVECIEIEGKKERDKRKREGQEMGDSERGGNVLLVRDSDIN